MSEDFIQSWPGPKNPKPIIFIGAGGIVRNAHIPAYQKAALPIDGVFDVDAGRAESLAKDFGLHHIYSSLEDVISKNGTDVVYDIATPPDALSNILPHLPNDAAVLMQKPMGANQDQARQIRQIVRERSLKAAVNFQLRFAPMIMAVSDAVKQGKLGQMLDIEVHLNVYTPWNLFPFLIPMERVEIAVHSIHYLDTIRLLVGDPQAAFVRSMRDPRAAEFAQTRTSAILDYGQDLRVTMSINHNHQCGRRFQSAWIRCEGEEGTMMVKLGVMYDYPNGEPDELWHCPKGGKWQQIKLAGSWFIDAFMGTMRNVQRYDSGEDDSLRSSVEDAYHTMALVEACFKSMKQPAVPLALD